MSGRLKFVKRGGGAVASITEGDLNAHEWGSSPGNPLDTLRAQDLELPHEVSVLYINPAADYQQGTQKSQRQTGSGVGVLTIPLPVAMSDAKAKQVADVNHYNAWVARTTYTLQLSRKWAKLEPTDVIDVTYRDVTLRMRITSKDDAVPGIITLACVAEDSAIYSQSGMGAGESSIPGQVVTIPVQTLGMLLDIPMLRDADDDAGIYFAACGYRSGWSGCVVFKSNDDGATYTQLFADSNAAAIGYAITALGDFHGGNIFDELNTVTVQMVAGTLSSVSETLVLNGENYAVIGNEIVQFKNATLVSPGVYTLSGLLRGRKGSEWAMPFHTIGERFAFVSASTFRRVPFQTSDIGLERLFKFPTFGMTLQQAAPNPFTPAGVALECYSPVEVGAGRNVNGDYIINWKRRGRISAEWRDYTDIPLGEAAESYEVDVMDSTFTTVKRTIAVSTNTATYTAAQQIADSGEISSTLYLRVYQISAVTGRGYPAPASFELPIAFSSTQWRIYVTAQYGVFTWLEIQEVEMMATVGGADQCAGGSASASTTLSAGWEASNAFDNTTSTWGSSNTDPPHWIQYTFAAPVSVLEFSITANAFERSPTAFALEFYNGSTWVRIFSVAGQSFSANERKTYAV